MVRGARTIGARQIITMPDAVPECAGLLDLDLVEC